ncbi:MAG: hypothetical protein AABW48_04300 [Nanoarchaeota archaeon]
MAYQHKLPLYETELDCGFLREQHILHSGDLELIAHSLAPSVIREHFGENSFEYLALEQRLADELNRDLNASQKLIGEYIVPRRTENPANTFGMLRNWIIEFHRSNDMKLPKYFYRRNKRQLRGMYYGMLRTYELTIDDVVPEGV